MREVHRRSAADQSPRAARACSKPPHQAIEGEQAQRLALLRASRDKAAHRIALDDLKEAATGDRNLLYPMREALRARATVGEVCDALREVWGGYREADAPQPTARRRVISMRS
jgi:methylmalonyl-CoA mutase N-terminal domain/subunit